MKSIKSIISLSVIVMLLGISAIAYAAPNDPAFNSWVVKKQVGTKQSEPVRVIKLVRFSTKDPNGASVVSGDVLVYDTVSDDGVSVRLTTTSADGAIAGIACTAIASSDSVTPIADASGDVGGNNWGYIVVHGPANAKATTGGTNGNAAGDNFITSTDSGAITAIPNTTQIVGTNGIATAQAVRGRGGFFYDAASTATSYEVQVNLE